MSRCAHLRSVQCMWVALWAVPFRDHTARHTSHHTHSAHPHHVRSAHGLTDKHTSILVSPHPPSLPPEALRPRRRRAAAPARATPRSCPDPPRGAPWSRRGRGAPGQG
eukprot:scaffold104295_cov21-Phaeocystis_antarctica.AAC.1